MIKDHLRLNNLIHIQNLCSSWFYEEWKRKWWIFLWTAATLVCMCVPAASRLYDMYVRIMDELCSLWLHWLQAFLTTLTEKKKVIYLFERIKDFFIRCMTILCYQHFLDVVIRLPLGRFYSADHRSLLFHDFCQFILFLSFFLF